MPRPNSKSAIITGTLLIAKRTTTQIGEPPKLTCSASVGVPTEAWCSRCRRAKNVPGKCRRNLWYAYSNKLAHRNPTPKPATHCCSLVGKRIPSASAGKPPHKTLVQAFTRLIARPRAIAVALISVAVSTGTPTSACPCYFRCRNAMPGLLPQTHLASVPSKRRHHPNHPESPIRCFRPTAGPCGLGPTG